MLLTKEYHLIGNSLGLSMEITFVDVLKGNRELPLGFNAEFSLYPGEKFLSM